MYTRFQNTDIVTREAQELVTSTWTNNTNNLKVAHTASIQADFTTATSSGHFYIDVYNDFTGSTSAEVQYAVSYGHRFGSGSPDFTNDTGSFGITATRTVYNQYRQLHFNDDTKFFEFGTHTPDSVYVININRSRYKQRLTLGSLNLTISGAATGHAGMSTIKLTDDSVTNGQTADSNLGPVYNIVSGSNGVLSGSKTNQLTINASASTYGNFYPESGLIILNADAFTGSINPAYYSGSNQALDQQKPHERFLRHISTVGNQISLDNTGSFIVDTTEEINSQFYFVRAANSQFNYTNNESFIDNNKNIRFTTMRLNPKVFITTVGLYNDAFELVAIAKLSQPVAKDFTKEALIRVKLDY